MAKLERDDFGGTMDYQVASNTETGQVIDFYHDFEMDESWYVYKSKGSMPRVVDTLDEAIALWNKE